MSNFLVIRPMGPLKTCKSLSNIASIPKVRQFHAATPTNEASSRRLTQRLRNPPAPSFANTTRTQDHIIFNPPSSAPNVYHTPAKFLPQGDRRRQLYAAAAAASASTHQHATASTTTNTTSPSPSSPIARTGTALTAPSAPASPLPPPIRRPYEKKYHLSEAQLEEMRALRAADPRRWTRVRLGERFGCSQFFVGLVCQAPEIKAERERQLEEVKRRWGRRKREAREDRVRRRGGWGRGE